MRRVKALNSYAEPLYLIGETDAAIEIHEQLLEFRLPPEQEDRVRIIIGSPLGNRGEVEQALGHLERAVKLDLSNKALQEMIQINRNADPTL